MGLIPRVSSRTYSACMKYTIVLCVVLLAACYAVPVSKVDKQDDHSVSGPASYDEANDFYKCLKKKCNKNMYDGCDAAGFKVTSTQNHGPCDLCALEGCDNVNDWSRTAIHNYNSWVDGGRGNE